MKQNSNKPTTGAASPSNAGKHVSLQQGHQQHTHSHFQQMQPSVTFQQEPMVLPGHQQHLHQQQHNARCMVLPSTSMHQPPHAYMHPQTVQLPSGASPEGSVYVRPGMVTPNSQLPKQVGFSPSAQTAGRYHQTPQHRPMMSQVPQPNCQPPVADFGPSTAGFPSRFQAFKQHQQQQQQPRQPLQPQQPQYHQTMQAYQEAPVQYPVQVQPSFHPEGPASDAQYFFDANCTVPVVQQPSSSVTGCRNPKCTSCKSFQRS